MRSISQILWLVVDGEINTPEQGTALLDEEARDYADILKIPEVQARAQLLANIDDCARLCLKSDAMKLRGIFGIAIDDGRRDGVQQM